MNHIKPLKLLLPICWTSKLILFSLIKLVFWVQTFVYWKTDGHNWACCTRHMAIKPGFKTVSQEQAALSQQRSDHYDPKDLTQIKQSLSCWWQNQVSGRKDLFAGWPVTKRAREQGFSLATKSVSLGYLHKKQNKNTTKRTSLLYKSPPTNHMYPATWKLSDSPRVRYVKPLGHVAISEKEQCSCGAQCIKSFLTLMASLAPLVR